MREEVRSPGEEDWGHFAGTAADREDSAGQNAGEGVREDNPPYCLPLCRAERKTCRTEVLRNGFDCLFNSLTFYLYALIRVILPYSSVVGMPASAGY